MPETYPSSPQPRHRGASCAPMVSRCYPSASHTKGFCRFHNQIYLPHFVSFSWFQRPLTACTHPFGKLISRSLCGPSAKLATLNQLVLRFPFSSLAPLLTPRAYRITSRPVDVGVAAGVSAKRPMSCILARARGEEVLNARAAEGNRERAREIDMVGDVRGRAGVGGRTEGRREWRWVTEIRWRGWARSRRV